MRKKYIKQGERIKHHNPKNKKAKVDCQLKSNTAKQNAKCHKKRKITDKEDAN